MIKSAVVGCGYLGKFHAEKYYKSKNSELVAVVDPDESIAKKTAKSCKCDYLQDYKELPALGVQCASVASTTSTHYEIAKWLLENGIDVLVEKPMTTTIEEGEELVEIAKTNGRIIQAGHLERFNPAFLEMKKTAQNPWFFEVRRIAQFTGRGADVDVVLDLMIHDIDIISHLVGKPVEKIEAVGIPVLTQSVDIANARITFEGGAIANVTASRAAYKSERTFRVFQPNVYMSLDFGKKKLKIYTKQGQSDKLSLSNVSVKEVKIKERDALEHEIESFVASVRDRSEPAVSGEDGVRALELVHKVKEAFSLSMQRLEPELMLAAQGE